MTRWHYGIVAHPIMTGMLLNLWATPIMTGSRLVCALFFTFYIVVAVLKYEEPSIRDSLGEDYDEYLKKTSRFFPGIKTLRTMKSNN